MPRLVGALSAKAPDSVIEAYLVLVLTALRGILKRDHLSLQPGEDRRILELQQRIRERPLDLWSLPEMERVSGLARSRLDELFRRQAGDSPVAFARRVRLEWAGRCLLERPSSVTEIAHECGFSSSQHFSRAFRLLYGCTPSEFRERGTRR
jgi:AraC-like DNA-binding protein